MWLIKTHISHAASFKIYQNKSAIYYPNNFSPGHTFLGSNKKSKLYKETITVDGTELHAAQGLGLAISGTC